MTETTTPNASNPRTTYVGLWIAGTLLYVGLLIAGHVLAGVATFALFAVGAVTYHHTTDRTVFDERDEQVLQAASANTIALVGQASAVVFPSTAALSALGYLAWPTWLSPIALFVTGLFALWGVMILLARR